VTRFTKLILVSGVLLVLATAASISVNYWFAMGKKTDIDSAAAIRSEGQAPSSELSWMPAGAQSVAAGGMQQACSRDMQLLCSDVEPGGGRIFRCLAQRQGDVSEGCGSFLRRVQARQQGAADNQPRTDRAQRMVAACGTDMQKLCADTEPGEGRKARCLVDRKAELSVSCSSFLQGLPAWSSDGAPPEERNILAAADNQPRDDRTQRIVAAACGTDMRKLCANIEPGEGRKARCLVDRKAEISVGCSSVLQGLPVWSSEGAPPEGRNILAKCEQDMKKFCKEIERGEGRIVQCLRAQQSGISSACQSLLTELPDPHKSE
jgi:golgi apparatus protein 1